MKLNEFVKVYLGKKTDWDGVYGVQCVDLIDAYIEKVLELKVEYFGNAKTWWENRNSEWLKEYFTAVTPKYKDGELKAGDIGIRTMGTFGHIFIVAEKNKNGKIKYYDQNASGNGEAMTLREKPYTKDYINGVLRPKNQSNLVKEETSVAKYGNAAMLSAQTVYADSDLTLSVGSVSKGERVKALGTGEGNPIIAYKTSSGYKVGFVKKSTVKKD